MHWSALLHLGDPPLTLAAAAAIAAWLAAARAWRMAFWWSALFAAGIGLVAASKIAFLAYGSPLPALNFRTISGHATGVTAIAPTLIYLLLQHAGRRARVIGFCAGLAIGAAMALLLVATYQHSIAEAIAGLAMGATVSLSAIALGGAVPPLRAPAGLATACLAFALALWIVRPLPLGYIMYRLSRLLTHNATTLALYAGC